MERIKQALERARDEREARTAGVSATTTGQAIPTQAPVVVRPAATPAQGITYTETGSFEVSPKVLRRQRVVTALKDEDVAVAYKLLRTQVLQRLKTQGWNALAVTSPGCGEGKTLTAVNLAASIAAEVSYTVLLVDLDLRHPSVHRLFGVTPEHGIGDHLLRDVPLKDVLLNPGQEGLVILPGREAIPNSSELLGSPKMVGLVEELKSRYPARIVIFDLPPVLSADDALSFSPYVDAFLMVVEEGKTTRPALRRAMGFLREAESLGTVLNKSRERILA